MDDGGEDDEHEDGADDAPPPSIAPFFQGRGPPTAEEWRRFKLSFREDVRAYTKAVYWRLKLCGVRTQDLEALCQEVFARVFAFVKRKNVPTDMPLTLSSTAYRTGKAFLRDEGRKAKHGRALQVDADEEQPGAGTHAYFRLLLYEGMSQLSTADADLLRWVHVEERSPLEIAAWLGLPEDTLRSRLRVARGRLRAIVDPKSEKDPRR